MAVDEALLRTPESGWVLRFYRWFRPTVSLGYGQPVARGVDLEAARRHGIDLVRRPTGGRAVLHADEITYSLVGPCDQGVLAGGISASYRRIAGGLQAGLSRWGVEVEIERGGAAPAPGAKGACFSARTRYELSAGGRKLVGSAQRRVDGRLLQHGSLLVGRPRLDLWSALGPGYADAVEVSVGLEELCGARPSRRALIARMTDGIGEALALAVRCSTLSRRERRRARGLARKYRDRAWTSRF